MKNEIGMIDTYGSHLIKKPDVIGAMALHGKYDIVCFAPDRRIKWREVIDNLVVTVGRNHALEAVLDAATQITSWFVGLTDGTPTVAAGDTMASHAGWVEIQNYTEGTREAAVFGTVSAGSIDNVASVASFAINATVTIGGAFLISNSTKGGTTGTLYSVGAFTGGDKSADSGDTLEVTVTMTATSS